MGSRSKARKRAVELLYEADLRGSDATSVLSEHTGSPDAPVIGEYTVTLIEGVTKNQERIDELLTEHAEGWTLARMPPVDRAVLRLGLYELLWGQDVPSPVAIDEAVEVVKSLSTDDSPRFVNGVLGRIAGISDRLRNSMRNAEQGAD